MKGVQSARLNLHLLAALGVILTVQRGDGVAIPLKPGHEDMHELKPGDRIVIEVKHDERWEAAQKRREDTAAAAAAVTDDVNHADDDAPPTAGKVEASPGEVVQDTGATRTRTTSGGKAT